MNHHVVFWTGIAIANGLLAWIYDVPYWGFPVVAVIYIGVLLTIDRFQKSGKPDPD